MEVCASCSRRGWSFLQQDWADAVLNITRDLVVLLGQLKAFLPKSHTKIWQRQPPGQHRLCMAQHQHRALPRGGSCTQQSSAAVDISAWDCIAFAVLLLFLPAPTAVSASSHPTLSQLWPRCLHCALMGACFSLVAGWSCGRNIFLWLGKGNEVTFFNGCPVSPKARHVALPGELLHPHLPANMDAHGSWESHSLTHQCQQQCIRARHQLLVP